MNGNHFLALTLSLMAMMLLGCRTQKETPTNNLVKIEFGGGGGITGRVQSSCLTSDRVLVKTDNTTVKVSAERYDEIVKLSSTISQSYVNPGNIYNYVNIYRRNDTVYCSWVFGDKNIDNKITNLYKKLVEL